MAAAVLVGATAASQATERPSESPTPSLEATLTSASPTLLPPPPTAVPVEPTAEATVAEPTATQPPPPEPPVSDVLPVVEPAEPVAVVRGGTQLPVPEGTSVVRGECASDGECHWYNFYWAPTHEVVMQHGEGPAKVQHELCHAHQHWAINGGAPLVPSDYDLESWYAASEGTSFQAAVDGLSWPWTHSAVNGLEDFAWTCAYWYLDPAHLLNVSPERYAWAELNLP